MIDRTRFDSCFDFHIRNPLSCCWHDAELARMNDRTGFDLRFDFHFPDRFQQTTIISRAPALMFVLAFMFLLLVNR